MTPTKGGRMTPSMLVFFAFCTLDLLTISIQLPVLQKLYEAQGLDLIAQGWVQSAFSVASFFAGPFLAAQSDSLGRVKMLQISSIVNLAGIVGMMLSTHQYTFILSKVLPGFFKCGIPTAQAYLADVSGNDQKKRDKNFGLMGAFFGIAFIIGPIIGGICASRNPIYALGASSVAALASLLLLFFVPEPARKTHDKASGRPLERPSTMSLFKGTGAKDLMFHLHNRFFFWLGSAMHQSSFVPFLMRLGRPSSSVGMALSLNGVMSTLTKAVFLGMLTKRCSSETLQMWSLILMGLSWLVWPQLSNYACVLALSCVLTFGSGIFMTMNKSQLSTCVDQSQTGALMGLSTSLDTLAMAMAGPLAGFLFEYRGPAAPALTSACTVFYGAGCMWFGRNRAYKCKVADKVADVQKDSGINGQVGDGEEEEPLLDGSVKTKVE